MSQPSQDAAPPPLSAVVPPLHGLGRQGVLNATATLLPGLYAVAATGLILQRVGAAQYAPWALAVVVLGWLTLLDLGLSQTVVRASARAMAGDERAISDVHTAGWAYAWLGLLGLLIGCLAVVIVPNILHLGGTQADTAEAVMAILAIDGAIVLATASWAGTLRGAARFTDLLVASSAQVIVAGVLLVGLLPAYGLAGAAVAQVSGRLANRALVLMQVDRHVRWFRAIPSRPSRSRLTAVIRFSAPVFLIQLGTQIGSGTDIIIVGAISGPVAAGLYAAGVQLVRYVAYFIFPLVDVVFPRMSRLEVESTSLRDRVLVRSLLIGGLAGSVAFGTLAMDANVILEIWAGDATALSVAVLVLYAVAYVIITPVHLIVLGLIASGRHRIVSLVILGEALVNIVLSIWLTMKLGAVGPAVSTLVVVLVDDVLVIPLLGSRQLRIPIHRLLTPIFLGLAAGCLLVAAIHAVPTSSLAGMAMRWVVTVGVTGALVAGILRWDRRTLPGGPAPNGSPTTQPAGGTSPD